MDGTKRALPATLVGGLFLACLALAPTAFAQDSPGTINSGPASWGEGGSLSFLVDKADGTAGTNWSENNINGTLTFSSGYTVASTFTIDISSIVYQGDGMDNGTVGPATDFNPSQDYTWTVAHTTGGLVGFDPAKVTLDSSSFRANNATNGGQFALIMLNGGNDVAIKFIEAGELPEPGTAWLLLAFAPMAVRIAKKENSLGIN